MIFASETRKVVNLRTLRLAKVAAEKIADAPEPAAKRKAS